MTTKITLLKTALIALFLFVSNLTFGATYYACTTSTLTFTTPNTPGITYSWDVKGSDGISITGFPDANPPSKLETAGTYTVLLISTQTDPAGIICPPDPVDNTIIILPALTMDLVDPTNPSYCGAGSTTNTSDITITGPTLPTGSENDLELEYTYTVNNGTTDVDGTTVGTIDAATGKFTLTTTDAGTYTVTGKVKYSQKTGFTNALLGSGCEVTSTNTETITVLPKPATPTITVTGV